MKNYILGWIIVIPAVFIVLSAIAGICYGLYIAVNVIPIWASLIIGGLLLISIFASEEISNIGRSIRER